MGTKTTLNGILVALATLAGTAWAQIGPYEVVDLGTLGGTSSVARAISGNGQVTGDSLVTSNYQPAFIWSEQTGMVNAGTLGGPGSESWGINDGGAIVGVSLTQNLLAHAYLRQNGVTLDIHPSGIRSFAWAINNDNDVVGFRGPTSVDFTAFIRRGNGQVIYGPLGSELLDITDPAADHGAVAVGYWPAPESGGTFVATYDLDDNTVHLTGIAGTSRGINQARTIVGRLVDLTPFITRADNNYATYDIITPLPGYTVGQIYDLNDYEVAVGMNSTSESPMIGVLYAGGTLLNINSLLDPVSGAGWVIKNIRDINNHGWMVAGGARNGVNHGVLLRPTDADGDGLNYHDEVFVHDTDPLLADSDDDGLNDGEEIGLDTDPLAPDSDSDGLEDGFEVSLGTDPLLADSDGDGASDSVELTRGTNPLIPESIAVTSPNGGEVILRGTYVNITWNTAGNLGANVKIISRKGTSSGVVVASTPNDGVYEWLVPMTFPLATNNLIEISSLSYPTILDTSNSYFSTVAGPTIAGTVSVGFPNGGETLQRGSTVPILWSSTGYIGGAVKIYLRRGTTGATIIASTPNDGRFDWTIPSYPIGAGYVIEVSAVFATTILDASDATFSLSDSPPPATLTVTTPNGGESYIQGATVPITWTSTGTVGSDVQILAHGGAQHVTLAASTPNDGAFDWAIPASQPAGTDYLIEVRSLSAPAVGDSSNAAFIIVLPPPPPTITVTSPNGGESYIQGTTAPITWTSAGAVGSDVQILAHSGAQHFTLTTSTSNDGTFDWVIPANQPTGTDYLIEVRSVSAPAVGDSSDAAFTVALLPPPPSITVTAPSGGESYVQGATVPVTWTSTGAVGSYVQITAHGCGLNFVLAANTPNDGAFDWVIPANQDPGIDYQIEVQSLMAPAVTDRSDGYFMVTASTPLPLAITVTAPNGGESYIQGATVPITWTVEGTVGNDVQIVAHSGTQDFTVTASTANDGAFDWAIPLAQAPGTDYRIEVRSVSAPAVTDSSNAAFTIALLPPPATITVVTPNGGQSYIQGTTVPIVWTSTGAVGSDVQIVAHSGTQDYTVTASTANDGAFDWAIPLAQAPGMDYRVEVRSVSAPAVTDSSDAAFTIALLPPPAASITVLSPNGGETLVRGTTVEITWSSTGTIGANVKIVARKGTASSTLAGATPNDGSYSWKIPSTYPLGPGVTIEISSVATPTIVDASNGSFNIGS